MRAATLAAMILGGLAIAALSGCGANAQEKARTKNGRDGPSVLVTIAKDTTYITEPLRKDGYPDYVAALDRRLHQGVTPENNAAVLFWKAVGPKAIPAGSRDEYFRRLDVPGLPEKGDYYVYLLDYAETHPSVSGFTDGQLNAGQVDALWSKERDAAVRPWSKEEIPILIDYLTANEKSLALMVAASKRARRYEPLFCLQTTPGGSTVGGALAAIPGRSDRYRHLARTLSVRAMLRLNEGNVDGAWDDVLAAHRLARLCGQGAWLVDCMEAALPEETVCANDRALLEYGHLSAAQLAKMREDLVKLPPAPRAADKLDLAERLTWLDGAVSYARDPAAMKKHLADLATFTSKDVIHALIDPVDDAKIEWDMVLRTVNRWFDEVVEAVRRPTRGQRIAALRKAHETLHARTKAAIERSDDSRQSASERVGLAFAANSIAAMPDITDVEDRAAMRLELTKLAFALAHYRAEQGSYPEKLAELVPKYLDKAPNDIFSDAPLHYRREAAGYLLYSVGRNGKDDGGVGFEYGRQTVDAGQGDDEVIRVPAAKK